MRFPDPVRRAFARYLIASVLSVVACRQLYLAHTSNLTSWLGGGMGMFATIDGLEYRVVRARLTTTDGQEWPLNARTSRRLGKLEGNVRVMPTDERLHLLAQELASVTKDENSASIHVTCWRMTLNSANASVQLAPIRDVSLAAAPPVTAVSPLP